MSITISGTTGIAGVDGSAGTPAVQGADTNTGIFFPAADTIAFAEGGTEVMRIDSSGNVGIGTSSPESFGAGHKTLEVSGSTSGEGGVFKTATVGSAGSGSSGTEMLAYTDSAGGKLNVVSTHPLVFYTANTERGQFDTGGNFKFNSGYGSVATAYGCRAWVNFDGTANTNLSGTYSRTSPSTTLTVTATAHGLIVGNSVNLDFTTGTGLDGIYTVVTVADANTFTITTVASTTTSGNVTLLRNTIRASGNVSSITDNGTGDYTVNFTTAMPDENYAWSGNIQTLNGLLTGDSTAQTTTALTVASAGATNNTKFDTAHITIAIFR